MATLLDYTTSQFPNHTAEVWDRDGWTIQTHDTHTTGSSSSNPVGGRERSGTSATDLVLTDHTVIAHVIGEQEGLELLQKMRDAEWPNRLGAVLVCPSEPTVVPTHPEDQEGVVDLPNTRIAASSLAGALLTGVVAVVVTLVVTGSPIQAAIVGTFAAIVGAVITGMLGGGGRHAGERAWGQPQVPGRSIAVVAAFADNEHEALDAARMMERTEPHDIRVVNAHGDWHSPNT